VAVGMAWMVRWGLARKWTSPKMATGGVGEAVAVVGLESCAAAKLHLAPCLAEDAAKGEPEFLTLGSERGGDK